MPIPCDWMRAAVLLFYDDVWTTLLKKATLILKVCDTRSNLEESVNDTSVPTTPLQFPGVTGS